jgi:sialate O-acetylesterase
MPFYFVQLANFMDPQTGPEESAWAELREAQAMTLRLPFTGMALAIDAGEATDIHPIRKDIVAERLARLALARTYGQRVVDSGPVYAGMHIEGNRVRLSLKHANGLRTRDGEAPSSFQVAGADRKWHMARAKVDGDAIVVWHPDVKAPVAVRHAWANNPHVNVVNAEGLPLAPFRTDRWPETTREKN